MHTKFTQTANTSSHALDCAAPVVVPGHLASVAVERTPGTWGRSQVRATFARWGAYVSVKSVIAVSLNHNENTAKIRLNLLDTYESPLNDYLFYGINFLAPKLITKNLCKSWCYEDRWEIFNDLKKSGEVYVSYITKKTSVIGCVTRFTPEWILYKWQIYEARYNGNLRRKNMFFRHNSSPFLPLNSKPPPLHDHFLDVT